VQSTSPTQTPPQTRRIECMDCGASFDVPVYGGGTRFLNALRGVCDLCGAKRTMDKRREDAAFAVKARFCAAMRLGDLPPAFRKARLANSDPMIEACNSEAYRYARKWDGKRWLYFEGPPGTGKTFLAMCLLVPHFVAGKSVVVLTARRILKTADRFDEGRGAWDRWCSADYLLLDDIDKAEWTARRLESLWELFDARRSGGLATLITSNVSLGKNLEAILQPAGLRNGSLITGTIDRMRPMDTLKLLGESHRGKQAATAGRTQG